MQPFKDDTRRQARRPSHGKQAMTTSRIFSHNLPDRLKDDHDAQVDFTAPPGGTGSRNGQMHYMQQSVFSMLAAVGSKSDFRARFDESSDSDEQDEEKPRKTLSASTRPRVDKDDHSAMQSTGKPQRTSGDRGRRHRRSISEHELSHPFSSLEGHVSTETPSSTEIPRAASPTRPRSATPTAVPVLSRMVEARANLDTGSNPTAAGPPSTENEASQQQSASPLSLRLKDMFGFETPEKIRAEYPCSLLQSILLQGYMYITEGHLCFYAYLPKKSTTVIKSGNLHKRGRKNPQYTRYWFSLKEDVLSYFADQSNLYFPSGHVDLRYGISASLADSNEKNKDVRDFQVTTDQNTYYFRADSAASAKEWVKALQKVIFRTHNEGNSVKISFPIENIIDIEESPMVEFAETMKIQIDDSFAIDEYYFTFFNFGREAFTFVKSLLGDPSAKSAQTLSPRIDGSKGKWMAQHEGGTSRRRSASASHISHGNDVIGPPKQQDSADSFAHSLDQATESSAVLQSMTDTNESASQILNRSDVFHSPTIQKLRRRSSADKAGHQHSDETAPPMKANNAGSNGPEIQFAGSESEDQQVSNMSTPALNDLVRAGAYPIQRAAGLAGYLRTRSMQMGTLLTSESMGYIEKVSGMWAGRHRHYGESESVLPDDQAVDAEDKTWGSKDGDRFRAHFALPSTERLQAAYYAHLNRVLPLYGKIYISQRKLCFRSLIYGVNTKMILPLKDIENVGKEKGFRFGYHGLVVVIRGHEELFFEFNTAETRDDCAVTLHQHLESVRFLVGSGLLAEQDKEDAEAAKTEHRMLQEARISTSGEDDSYMPTNDDSEEFHPVFDDPRASIINFKPSESLRITCLTIGSRGDVQPYIALCKGLLAEGHRPKIATHAEFEPWVKKHGIDFAPVDGDPAELMRICVENGMFTYSFLREASMKFRGWIDDLLSSAWRGCQDSDLLIESPSAMAGIHIAEALQIPYFRAFTMPWTRTRTYPHAFAVPEQKMGGAYNYITYVMFDNVFWKAIAGQVNRWRKKELGLKATNLDRMKPNNVPFLYNFSPSVVPPPLDFPDWIRITGYWFLSEGTGWKPPHELVDFIQRARKDGKKIVYIGFGSIVVSDPSALTRTVVESVQKADVRCILSKGWSDRLGDPSSTKSEIPLPPEIYQIQAVPHDWLFSQIDAAAHHGGAGTTGASLRAGVPTIIKPFFGDQFFFGTRVEDLGVGICMNKLNVSIFSRALWEATHSERIIAKARDLGVKIRSEDGVNTAIQAIYRDLEYAKTLVKKRSRFSSTPFSPKPSAQDVAEQDIDEDAADSEEWTFIGDDTDIDISKRVRDRAISEADMLPGPVSCSMG